MITDFRKPEPETVEMMVETAKKTKEEEVLEACENLRKFSMQAQYDQNKIEVDVMNLGQKFKDVVDSILESHIQVNIFQSHKIYFCYKIKTYDFILLYLLGIGQGSGRTEN